MNAYSHYENEVNRIIKIQSEEYKNSLKKGKIINEKSISIYNKEIKKIKELLSSKLSSINNSGIGEFNNFFQKRTNELNDNDKHIIEVELFDMYNEDSNLDFEKIIIEIAQYSSLLKVLNTVDKGDPFFEKIYYHDLWDDYSFPIGDRDILDKIDYITNKVYSKDNSISKSLKTEIIIDGIKFNLMEFAVYMRTLYRFLDSKIEYKDIYDKVIEDYNDPFNYFNKVYKKTTFYGYLLDEKPKETKSFNLQRTYHKILIVSSYEKFPEYNNHIKSMIS